MKYSNPGMSKFLRSGLFVIVLLLPVIVFLGYSFFNSGALFRADDFHLLKTVVWFQDATDPLGKFKLLIQQHNEHRIIIPRLLAMLDYHIEGWINWRTLILVGNLLWVSVLYFFWRAFRMKGIPVWMFIPLPYILFQPQYSDNVNWAISILQQSVIVFWFCLFCYLFVKRYLAWAMVVAILATFTHGNGIFSFGIGIVLLALDRDWKGLLRWLSAFIIIGVIYFWGFGKGQNANFQASFSDPIRLFMAFFAFWGAISKIQLLNPNYAALCGLVFAFVLALYLFPKLFLNLKRGTPMTLFDKLLFGNVLFLVITAALVSISRSWSGLDNIVASRYQHYSPFVACWVYIVILAVTKGTARRSFAIVFIAASLLFNFKSYFVYNQEVVFRKNWLVADGNNWAAHGVFLDYAKSFNSNIKETYREAVGRGVCRNIISLSPGSQSEMSVDSNINFDISKNVYVEKDAQSSYQREYLKISNQDVTGTTFLYLKGSQPQGYWLPTFIHRNSILGFLSTQNKSKPGFSIEFLTENFPSGQYRIGILNNGKFSWTQGTVVIGI